LIHGKQPTSLSKNTVARLLQDELRYDGLTFTDALEMKGVTKYFPAGEAAVQALMAGNDMLCLPDDVEAALEAVKKAVKQKRLKWKDIDDKVQSAGGQIPAGLSQPQVVDTTNLLEDLNSGTEAFKRTIARNTVTVLRNETAFPLCTQPAHCVCKHRCRRR
jgi:beta-N-acetylhexosaminidase